MGISGQGLMAPDTGLPSLKVHRGGGVLKALTRKHTTVATFIKRILSLYIQFRLRDLYKKERMSPGERTRVFEL
jgi:hypothetical protein